MLGYLTQPSRQRLSDLGNAGDGAAAVAVGEDGRELLIDGIVLQGGGNGYQQRALSVERASEGQEQFARGL